ncbi:hypothetical protein [Snuella lapsa]|uniref:Uncharacterized protein n=1 Tax=Snuella lapsa TaxID=870481 RepID=A0ABP6Y6U3_9FLAO
MKKHELHNIKSPGFNLPEGYFDAFEEHLLNEIKLKQTVKRHGFKVPEGYLDAIEDHIMDKISSTNNNPKIIQLFNRKSLLYAASAAACLALLLNSPLLNTKITWDSLDIETVENYIVNENLETYEIASLFSEEDLESVDIVNYTFNEETLETYLLNHLNIENLIIE